MKFLKKYILLLFVFGFSISCYAQMSINSFALHNDKPNEILVKWSTANETNVSYFNILISNDGANFKVLARVSAQGDNANQHNYSYVIQSVSSTILGTLPFFIFLLIPSVRNIKLRFAIFAIFALMVISCSKNEEETELKPYYIQLQQADNDGKQYIYETTKSITIQVPKK